MATATASNPMYESSSSKPENPQIVNSKKCCTKDNVHKAAILIFVGLALGLFATWTVWGATKWSTSTSASDITDAKIALGIGVGGLGAMALITGLFCYIGRRGQNR